MSFPWRTPASLCLNPYRRPMFRPAEIARRCGFTLIYLGFCRIGGSRTEPPAVLVLNDGHCELDGLAHKLGRRGRQRGPAKHFHGFVVDRCVA
jgi:hypothetical protein